MSPRKISSCYESFSTNSFVEWAIEDVSVKANEAFGAACTRRYGTKAPHRRTLRAAESYQCHVIDVMRGNSKADNSTAERLSLHPLFVSDSIVR